MSFFQSLFGSRAASGTQNSSPSVSPDYVQQSINLLAERVADFKDKTSLSYALILPALQQLGVRLLVQAQGIEFTKKHYSSMIRTLQEGPNGIRLSIFDNFNNPEIPADELQHHIELNTLLWKSVNELTARGYDLESISHACFTLATEAATKALDGLYAMGIIVACYRELEAGKYDS
jgi:hypothetical protein